jgi:hypothetical protein
MGRTSENPTLIRLPLKTSSSGLRVLHVMPFGAEGENLPRFSLGR